MTALGLAVAGGLMVSLAEIATRTVRRLRWPAGKNGVKGTSGVISDIATALGAGIAGGATAWFVVVVATASSPRGWEFLLLGGAGALGAVAATVAVLRATGSRL
ncbi:MAG: hypothetical protein ACYDGN_17715 [Acidimicrobiales bacterium]